LSSRASGKCKNARASLSLCRAGTLLSFYMVPMRFPISFAPRNVQSFVIITWPKCIVNGDK
jgi:hypothetical protein